jgi:hypothetical protein
MNPQRVHLLRDGAYCHAIVLPVKKNLTLLQNRYYVITLRGLLRRRR